MASASLSSSRTLPPGPKVPPLVDLRNLLGHETLDKSIRYVGVDSDELAASIDRFEQAMRESLTVPQL